MKDEKQDDLYSRLERKVPKSDRGELAALLTRASEGQREQLQNFKKAQHVSSFHYKVACCACIIATMILILDCLLYSLLLPYQTQMADYARTNSERFSTYYAETSEYGKTGEVIVDGFAYSDWGTYLKSAYSEYNSEYNENTSKVNACEEALIKTYESYTAKLSECQTARVYLNDKYNNYIYPTHWLANETEPQEPSSDAENYTELFEKYQEDKAEYDSKKTEYEKKIANYQTYESSIDELEKEYAQLLEDCINKTDEYCVAVEAGISLRTKYGEAIAQADKAKVAGLSVTSAIVSDGLLYAYETCLSNFSSVLTTLKTNYESSVSVDDTIDENKTHISELQAQYATAKSYYEKFLSDPLGYIQGDFLTLYGSYLENSEKLEDLTSEYQKAKQEYEAAKDTSEETKKYQEYLTAKQNYDNCVGEIENYNISKTELSYFSLGNYAEVVSSCQKAKKAYEEATETTNKTEKYEIYSEYLQQIADKEKQAENIGSWTDEDYYAALKAYDESYAAYESAEEAYNTAKAAADEKEKAGTLTEAEKTAIEEQKAALAEQQTELNATLTAIRACVNGKNMTKNYIKSFLDSERELEIKNDYSLKCERYDYDAAMSEHYYNLEFIASQLQIYYNITLQLEESNKADIEAIIAEELPETVSSSYLTDKAHSSMHDKIMEKGGVNSYFENVTEYLSTAQKYDLSASILAEFDVSDIDFVELLDNLSTQYAGNLSGFSGRLGGLKTISETLSALASSYKLSADKFAMTFLVYNSILIGIAFFYFVGELLIGWYEKRKANYEEIKGILMG